MYKVGVSIVVVYQASNIDTGKTIAMDIYDETYAKDIGKSVAAMTEMGTTGRYYAAFTPDAKGEWVAMMYDTSPPGKGHVVKAFMVGDHSINSIGDVIDAVNEKTNNLPRNPADQNLVEDAIAVAESNIRGVNGDTLKTLADQLAKETTLQGKPSLEDIERVDGMSWNAYERTLHAISLIEQYGDHIEVPLHEFLYGKLPELESRLDMKASQVSIDALADQLDALESPPMVG